MNKSLLFFPPPAGSPSTQSIENAKIRPDRKDRILLVDDEETLLRTGQIILTALGYEVEVERQPEVALALVRANPSRFALVITDQAMPLMTGLQLATAVQKITPGLPILLLTGYGAAFTPQQIEAAGICQLLLKPAPIPEFGAAVVAALALRTVHRPEMVEGS